MRVGIVLYEDVEPIEVGIMGTLSMARRVQPAIQFHTVSENGGEVALRNGVVVRTDYDFSSAPECDITLITGGPGWQVQAKNDRLLGFLRSRHSQGNTMVSVCTGAMLLAAAGLLKGRQVTTKASYAAPEISPFESLAKIEPDCTLHTSLLVDEGDIITGGGVSLCVDLTLYLIERHYGAETSKEVARIMEYSAAREANLARLPVLTPGRLAVAANQ